MRDSLKIICLTKSNVSQALNPIDGGLSVFEMTPLYQNMINSEFRNLTGVHKSHEIPETMTSLEYLTFCVSVDGCGRSGSFIPSTGNATMLISSLCCNG